MSLKKLLFDLSLKLRFQSINGRRYCTKSSNILESAEEKPIFLKEKEDNTELELKRNKSRLSPAHRNILFDQKPYSEPMEWYHETVKYKKRILGRYGMKALGVPVGLAWPSLKEVENFKEYERFVYSPNIQERLQKIKLEKKQKEEAEKARQEQVISKMAGMQKLINSVQEKIAKKQAEELEAKLRKEKKIEEIRRQLIAEGRMSKEKLQEALISAEKIEKKMKKQAKKAKIMEREKRILEELTKNTFQNDSVGSEEINEDEVESKKK